MFIPSDNSTVVVDIGTETYKIGYSDKEFPRDYNSSKTYQNDFNSPITRSTISNFDSYIDILNKIPEDTSYLLISENTFEDEGMKEKILSEVMEKNKASALIFSKSAILESFSYGRSTSIVISLSGGSTQISSVVDGYITYRKKIDFGCEDISKKFLEKTDKNKLEEKFSNISGNLNHFKNLEYGRSRKEDFYVKWADAYMNNENIKHQFDHIHENMFKIASYIEEVINNNAPDKKTILLNNILITGGGSYISNVSSIIEKLILEKYNNICVINNPSTFHAYFGGAIMGNIGSFKSLNIGKADYQECGIEILKRKNQSWVVNKKY